MRIGNCCSVVELRQYTVHQGQRDVLIELFDREFVEAQEAVGMHVVGQFRDADRADRFCWLRGFPGMDARERALRAFYGGPVWATHGDQANATMVDFDDVLLLRPLRPASGFPHGRSVRRPVGASQRPSSVIAATVCLLAAPVDEDLARLFERQVAPALAAAGAPPLACFQTETARNTYPALPVRSGEHVLVWFSSFDDHSHRAAHVERLARSPAWTSVVLPRLASHLSAPLHHLRLEPTARSELC